MMAFDLYDVVCHSDDSTYVASIPAIAGCHAVGASPAEARSELENVFEMIREEFEERGEPLPALNHSRGV